MYHTVIDGDCILSIANKYGFDPDKLWEAPANEALRRLRKDPGCLRVGDMVFIPDKSSKTVPRDTGATHVFVRKGVPARFRLRLLCAGQPRANLSYQLLIDDTKKLSGTTSKDGVLDVSIPPDAKKGILTTDDGLATYELGFGKLSPVTTEEGWRQRLINLGYLTDETASGENLSAATSQFRRDCGLNAEGGNNPAAQAKLLRLHDGRED